MVNLNSAENARLYNTNINQIGQVLKFKKTRQNAIRSISFLLKIRILWYDLTNLIKIRQIIAW